MKTSKGVYMSENKIYQEVRSTEIVKGSLEIPHKKSNEEQCT